MVERRMRVFIPSKGRADTIRTHKVFEGADYMIVVHNNEERKAYISNPSIPKNRVIVSGVKADAYGLTRQREWILENLVDYDEWFMFADDNIRKIEAVPESYYFTDELEFPEKYSSFWRKTFATPCDLDRFFDIAHDMCVTADEMGAYLCGFASVDNYYFRSNHWKTVAFVIGKLFLQNSAWDIHYNHTISMEDYYNTAMHFVEHGRILKNNYVRPHSYHYESGGMGRYEERATYREKDCTTLMNMFPGLFRVRKSKSNRADLSLKLNNEDKLRKWRKTMRNPLLARSRCDPE